MTHAAEDQSAPPSARPLFVDLDATLVATDTMWESILQIARSRPWLLLMLPIWAMRGIPMLKWHVASHGRLNMQELPFREDVLAFIREQKAEGRPVVLATASDMQMARAVYEHLDGLFDDVIATDRVENLRSEAKTRAMRQWRNTDAFDYMGDSHRDLPIWAEAHTAYLVSPSPRVRERAMAAGNVGRVFERDEPSRSKAAAMWRAMRPHQWVKNLLLAVPLFVGLRFGDADRWPPLLLAIAAFCLASSAVYVLNDLFDMAADRSHPSKRRRPFASGRLTVPNGLALIAALLVGAAALSLAPPLPPGFAEDVLAYLLLAGVYSLWAKGQAVLDVLLLAGLYVLRIIAGGVATDVPPSPWLLAFALFIFLSLAFGKRHAELKGVQTAHGDAALGRGYRVEDLSLIGSAGLVSGYLAVLVFCLYINSEQMLELYKNGLPQSLWLVVPLLVYWITRLWLLAYRGDLIDDPVFFALTDRVTWLIGALMVGVVLIAAYGGG